jgi:post-segregation antitoxin (ccd killing protein)
MSLHWYWDQAVQRNVDPDAVASRARELEVKIAKPASIAVEDKDRIERFLAWVEESYALAKSDGYRNDLKTSPQEKNAPALSSAYVARTSAIAEQRLTLASYRLADLLEELLTSD